MTEILLDAFQSTFIRHALIVSVLVAVPMALLSCLVVLKGWSLMGDAISHAILPGIVLAYILNLPFAIGAFAAGMFCATSTGYLKDNSRIKQDTAMGVVYSGMFGLGMVLFVKIKTDIHLDHILFGDMLGITRQDILNTSLTSLIVSGIILLKWKDLMLFVFDPAQIRVLGMPIHIFHYGLLCLISLTIVGALQVVGLVLSIAILIAPGAIAFLLTRSFSHMLIIAVLVSLIASLSGIFISLILDSNPAATIVLVFTVIFIGALIYANAKVHIKNRIPNRSFS